MASQPITDALRQWIVTQASAGQTPQAVLKAMVDAGWQEDTAIAALEETLEGHLARTGTAPAPAPELVVPVPHWPGPSEGIDAGDRRVRVLASQEKPRILVLEGFLSHDECDALVERARPRLTRSETVQTQTGGSEVNDARTSEGMFFEVGEDALCRRVEARTAALMRWPLENGEALQVLRYGPGAQYLPHYDYFDLNEPGTPTILARGGQRVGTLICYLNTPAEGGGTVFPDVGLEVSAIKGNAVFFSYSRPLASSLTLHGGAPVVAGEKWVLTRWVRERAFG